MKNALILHGGGNNSSGNWFPWLRQSLEEKGWKVWSPDLPDSATPNQEQWLEVIFSNKDWDFNSKSIIIGHSAGGTLALRILEKLPEDIKVAKAILVATYIDKGNLPKFYPYKIGMLETEFNWQKIRHSCKSFCFIASDNDPYDCGERHSKIMQEKLGGELILKKRQGHFNLKTGEKYKQFPALLVYLD